MIKPAKSNIWLLPSMLLLIATASGAEDMTAKVVTLSRHETVAEFLGTRRHQCRGLTALCPDKCGESGLLASFAVKKYLAYEKTGQYGDPRSEQFSFLIEDNLQKAKVPPSIRDTVLSLRKGEHVLLSWDHDYVTRDGVSAPQRHISRLERLPSPGSAAWMREIDRLAVRDGQGHGPDIGSMEWLRAVSLKLGVFDAQGHGPTPGSEEWQGAVHLKAFSVRPVTVIRAVYRSVAGERLIVAYDILRQTATLTTSAGPVVLPQALSASGARYAADDSEVFWNKGTKASYWKNGRLVFEGEEETD